MRILITAGGTSEKIDSVRSITNHSTGSLGKAIAEELLEKGLKLIMSQLVKQNSQLTIHD